MSNEQIHYAGMLSITLMVQDTFSLASLSGSNIEDTFGKPSDSNGKA
jgi:hypothetical protein